ncbi:hypothetical protein [Jiangella ureilytica]|uniref:hypothetical protein n=1 Tax=Jiangella ureilytica TaxID=2530374 RepID=UPI0013A5D040|nr:hypothetical protein [Jiangella ureilytica]
MEQDHLGDELTALGPVGVRRAAEQIESETVPLRVLVLVLVLVMVTMLVEP